MGRSVNRITLVGNAGSDPDVSRTTGGTAVAHVSLATNRVFKHNNEELYVEGRVEYGTYDRDGVAIPTTDVIVDDFVFLDGTPNGSDAGFAEATSEEFETV